MFTMLMASSPDRRPWSMSVWGGVSAALHVALFGGVLWLTSRATSPTDAPPQQITYIVYPVDLPPPPVEEVQPPEPEPASPPPEPAPPSEPQALPEPELPLGFQELEIPREIPVTIPAPSTVPIRAIDFTGVGVPGGTGEGYEPPAETVEAPLMLAVVDQPPQVKNADEVVRRMRALYPPLYREAGIEGRVIVQLVVDTEGRVERDGMQVISATHPEFGAAALEVARLVRFEPARRNGRPVRVWVQLPIDWKIDG